MILVGLVLVIACTNVAMLLVAKKSARQREFSLRLALGASRLQIFRQLLLESTLLVTIGAVLGWIFALAATRALASWSQIETGLAPDGTVLLFTLAICAVAAFAFGLAPLIPAWRAPVAGTLKSTISTTYRTRAGKLAGNVVMATQMGFCFVLLVAAGLLLRTLENYKNTNLGMRTQGLLVFGITPQKTSTTTQNQQFYRALLDRLRSLPGVESATVAENRPGSGWSDNDSATIDGVKRSYSEAPLRSNSVGPDFFHVLGVPIVNGRDITDIDTEKSQPVAVVNETFVKKLMGGANPIGHQLGRQAPAHNRWRRERQQIHQRRRESNPHVVLSLHPRQRSSAPGSGSENQWGNGGSHVDSRGCSGSRPESSLGESDGAAGSVRAVLFAASDVFETVRILRTFGGHACGGRTLRNSRVQARAPHGGDRREDGAGSAALPGSGNAGA